MTEPPQVARLGVSKLEQFFAAQGWLFREQLVQDYGIDAQVEIVKDENATGNLIGVQIKAGESYFSESTDGAIVFRPDRKHVEYWTKHSLPVILVLYHPSQDALFWERISESTLTRTGKGWRINVPKTKRLTPESLGELAALTQPPSYIQRLNKLRLDKAWIDLVANGEVVFVEFENWINKSLPRLQITIGCDSRDDIEDHHWPTTYGAGLSFEQLLSHLLPWAELNMDEDAHERFSEERWADECYQGKDEDGRVYYSQSFKEYYTPPNGIVPISDNGETEGYKLIVSLNDIGKAFLLLDEHLSDEEDPGGRVFTMEIPKA